jgi:GH24 family phage-related lysozyme (muramidase)
MSDDPVLHKEDHGDAVSRLQQLLVGAGFDPGPVDGMFGSGTEAAVRAFQAAKGLDVDGVVGSQTWSALRGGHQAGPTPSDPTPSGRSVSDVGLRLIEIFEGLSLDPYNDPVGHCTVGFGHLLHHGNCDGSEPTISHDEARRLLRSDAGSAGTAVSDGVTVELNQAQHDALVSFVFNVGAGNFADSTLRRLLNEGSYESVPPQLNRWVHAEGGVLPGLVRRRLVEGLLFRDGILVEDPNEAVTIRLPKPIVPPDGP